MQAYERLEKLWAEFNGLDPACMVCCSSGTSALHLALEALRLPPGSQVIVPELTMIACPRAVTLAGLTPVFVDCDDRLLIDLDIVSELTGFRSRAEVCAVMAVHIYGRRCNMDSIHEITAPSAPYIIEDLAEAHGVRPHPSTLAACWSFYRNKIVAGEEGGAVAFRNPEHAALARQLRCLGFTAKHDFNHVSRGCNYRMSNLHASVILEEFNDYYRNRNALNAFKRNTELRRQIERWYDARCPDVWRMPPRDAVWVYDLRIPGLESEQQGKIVAELNRQGIAARHAFKPCSLQEEYRSDTVDPKRLPWNAMKASQEVFYLPVQPGVTTEETAELAFDTIHRSRDRLVGPGTD